jgi:hypothetical protein
MSFKMTVQNIHAELQRITRSRAEERDLQASKEVASMKEELVAATPIDTGLARRSWSVEKRPGVFYVRNSAPYIEYLNQGSSKQAPARFIEGVALKYGLPIGTIVDKDE